MSVTELICFIRKKNAEQSQRGNKKGPRHTPLLWDSFKSTEYYILVNHYVLWNFFFLHVFGPSKCFLFFTWYFHLKKIFTQSKWLWTLACIYRIQSNKAFKLGKTVTAKTVLQERNWKYVLLYSYMLFWRQRFYAFGLLEIVWTSKHSAHNELKQHYDFYFTRKRKLSHRTMDKLRWMGKFWFQTVVRPSLPLLSSS